MFVKLFLQLNEEILSNISVNKTAFHCVAYRRTLSFSVVNNIYSHVKVSRSLRDLAYKAIQAKERLTVKLQREPNIAEIAEEIGEKRSEVVIALESISDPVSLYEPVYTDADDTLYIMDQISDKNDIESRMDEITIRDSIRSLGKRERNILYLRFFKGRTQTEVAEEIGISQAQVSRLEKGAIRSIKSRLHGTE